MILYTLLTTHTDVDMTNVILTACIVYYIGYNVVAGFVSDEYNYMGIAALALLDLYYSNGVIKSKSVKKQEFSKHKSRPQTKKRSKSKSVRINPYPTAIYRYPPAPPIQLPQYGQPQYGQPQQYVQPQYGQLTSQYGQPQQEMVPMIDNRQIAAELESSSSEESIESIAVSDTLSNSSEEY